MSVTGNTIYKNYCAQQHENFYSTFRVFLERIRPERILEIGTGHGGLIVALHDILKEIKQPCSIRTYDINEYPWYKDIRNLGVDIRGVSFSEEIDNIQSLIQSSGITLVLCDGGDKINEFQLLSNMIKLGDYIMCHDYSKTWEYFKSNMENVVWNWCEIEDRHIQGSIDSNNLIKIMEDDFQAIAWGCFQKQ